jgi:hypothetical protein
MMMIYFIISIALRTETSAAIVVAQQVETSSHQRLRSAACQLQANVKYQQASPIQPK